MRRALTAVAATAAVLVAAAPAQAGERQTAHLRIPGADGQKVQIDAGSGQVLLTTTFESVGDTRFDGAIYGGRGFVRKRRIRAEIGTYAHVDVQFKPRGKPRTRGSSRCEVTIRHGVFVGEATYLGEAGSPGASTTRAPGRIETADGCESQWLKRPVPAGLVVTSRTDPFVLPTLLFMAVRFGGKSVLSAFEISVADRTLIGRFTTLIAPGSSLSFNRRLTRATVQGESPFSGAASFRRGRWPRPWRGDLTAELVGDNLVPLTGAGLKADLLRFPTTGDADTIATRALMWARRSAQLAR